MVRLDVFETNERNEQINDFYLFDLNIKSPIKNILCTGKHFFIVSRLHITEIDVNFESKQISVVNEFDIFDYFGTGFSISKPKFTDCGKHLYCLVQSKAESAVIWIVQDGDATRYSIFTFAKKLSMIQINMRNNSSLFVVRSKQVYHLDVGRVIETVSPSKTASGSDGRGTVAHFESVEAHLQELCTAKSRVNYLFFNSEMTEFFLVLKSTNVIMKFEYRCDTNSAELVKEILGLRLDAKLIRFSRDLSLMIKWEAPRV